MKIEITDDPKQCGYDEDADVGTILTDDKDWMKELIENIKNTKDREIIRQAEKDFHTAMVDQYGSTIAGELMFRLWKATPIKEMMR